jgi:hypothetical protein
MNSLQAMPGALRSAAICVAAASLVFLAAGMSPAVGSAVSITLAAQAGAGPALNPQHPERYVVQRGDTLWDISAMFLRDPWYWPEIWYVNPQVENPHLIYPGDILTLVYVDGKPQIRLERGSGTNRLSPRVRESDLDEAISTIPFEIISAFLRKGAVLERDQYEQLPYIVELREQRLIGAAGNDVYVRGPVEKDAYSVIHIGDRLMDPDDNQTVGYEGIFVGEGTVRRGGDPSTLRLNESRREALEGDRLLQLDFDIPLNFYPRAPENQIDGSIIHVVDGISEVGQYQTVIINRGERDGLEPGHVLTVWQAGPVIRDRVSSSFMGEKVQLPDEMAGDVMVFKTYDRISYALVMRASTNMARLDRVRTPI